MWIEASERGKFVSRRRIEADEVGSGQKSGTAAAPDLGVRVAFGAGPAHHARNPQPTVLATLEQSEIRRYAGKPTDSRSRERQRIDETPLLQWHDNQARRAARSQIIGAAGADDEAAVARPAGVDVAAAVDLRGGEQRQAPAGARPGHYAERLHEAVVERATPRSAD